jgi:hypothetical protein
MHQSAALQKAHGNSRLRVMYSANIPPIDIDANLSARIGTLF